MCVAFVQHSSRIPAEGNELRNLFSFDTRCLAALCRKSHFVRKGRRPCTHSFYTSVRKGLLTPQLQLGDTPGLRPDLDPKTHLASEPETISFRTKSRQAKQLGITPLSPR